MTEETKYGLTKESEEDLLDSSYANEGIPLGGLESEVNRGINGRGIVGFISGTILTAALSYAIVSYNQEPTKELNLIPDVNFTELGYLTPNNIQIKMNDSNFNTLEETYFLHKEEDKWIPYLIKYGEKGIPEIIPYEIKEWPNVKKWK